MDKTKKLRNAAATQLKVALRKIRPVARVVQSATSVIGNLAKPTPLSVVNAVTGGLTTLAEIVDPNHVDASAPMYSLNMWVQPALLLEGYARLGCKLVPGTDGTEVHHEDKMWKVAKTGQLWCYSDPWEIGIFEITRRALDLVLPPVMRLTSEKDKGLTLLPYELTSLRPEQAVEIAARTKALLGTSPHRSVMLEGRPGIGKTTIAQAIAAEAGLGRVVVMDHTAIYPHTNVFQYELLSIGVMIVDDVDKAAGRGFNTGTVERMRAGTRLLILTANNGRFDTVIDGAVGRPDRIDEVFTIRAVTPFRRAPFDQLPDQVWDEVSQWPIAYLNELERRILYTPGKLRLKDLSQRLTLRTRSGDEMGEVDSPPDWDEDEDVDAREDAYIQALVDAPIG